MTQKPDKPKKTRRPLTAEEIACAARLKAIYEDRKRTKGLTQAEVGAKLGMSQSGVTQYLNGHVPLNLPAIFGFSEVLGCHPTDIDPSVKSFGLLRPEEEQLIEGYRKSNAEWKKLLLGTAEVAPEYSKIGAPPPKEPT